MNCKTTEICEYIVALLTNIIKSCIKMWLFAYKKDGTMYVHGNA